MAPIILSMDASAVDERKIRKAVKYVAGVENVEVYPDTGRVVVTGSADAAEVVTALESKLRVTVTIVSHREPPKLEFSSDEEDDSGDDEEEEETSSGENYYYQQSQPANLEHWAPWNPDPNAEWHGMGLPAIRTREPWWGDQPVPDTSSLTAPWNYTRHDADLPAISPPEPWSADQPVPDPSSWFEYFNFNLGNNSPPEDDDQ